jgi:cleavage and polyadenylation specificity factor subunit 1
VATDDTPRHLNTSVPQPAGLNCRSYRQPKTAEGQPVRTPAPHFVLDGELLATFEHLPWRGQAAAAGAAGMTREQALAYLHQLSARTAFM